jgi:hypothetical protein
MMGTASAQVTSEGTDNSTVTVDVASKVAIDISPSDISYSNIDPGSAALQSDGSDVGAAVGAVEIENIGSENITQVWLNTSVPNDNPFGTGLEQEYDAGNFIEVKPEGEAGTASDTNFRYINRKEFNETGDLSYVFTPDDAGTWKYGRFKVGSQEFFWTVNTTGPAGTCVTNDGGDDFRVGQNAHNQTHTGSTDFADGSYTTHSLVTGGSGDADALAAGVTIDPPGMDSRSYDVLVNCGDPTYTVRSSYNVNALGAPDLVNDGSAVEHILNATEAADPNAELQPGEHFGLNTSIRVPQGVPSGNNGITGQLRVFVNTIGN